MAIGRLTARLIWNICSSTSRLGILQVDDDDVGIDAVDAGEQVGHLVETDDLREPSLVQSLLQDSGPDWVEVDDDDLERWVQEYPGCERRLRAPSSPVPRKVSAGQT